MSTIVKNIHIFKNGAWHPISKVFHQGEWKKMKGIFYDGVWYEIGKTCVEMPPGCAIATNEHPRWSDPSLYVEPPIPYGRNNFKFNAIPGGHRIENGTFYIVGNIATYWISNRNIDGNTQRISMLYGDNKFHVNIFGKNAGLSIKAVKTYSGDEIDGTIIENDYKDGSDNYYNSVVIGNQLWTIENLYTTKYQNGDNIANVTLSNDWRYLKDGAYCWYNNDYTTYGQYYGALYNWYAVDNELVDYNGYRVPSREDWEQLIEYLTTTNWCDGVEVTSSNVAQYLKSCRQVNHPLVPNTFVFAGVFSGEDSIVGVPPVDYFKINNTTYQTSEEDYTFKYNYQEGDVITRLLANTGLRILDGNGNILYWDQELSGIVGPAYTIKSSDLTTGIKVEIMSYPT